MDKDTKRLRSDARLLDPILVVGKDGVTDGVVAQLDKELTARRLIKVQLRKSAFSEEDPRGSRDRIATELSERTRSRIIDRVGNMLVLYR